jgi:2-octaprenyl-6-methoxyphenol hydroxylase
MDDVADLAIVGGGPVGAALALALSDSGLTVIVLEARESGPRAADPRPLALSYGSRLILERLGVWHALAPATPIERIHISQQGGFGRVALSAAEARLPALGYVVDYLRLHAALDATLRGTGARYLAGATVSTISSDHRGASTIEFTAQGAAKTLAAQLVVIADGGALGRTTNVKTIDYRQSALTARVSAELPHRNTAFERFTADGPLALLPSGDELAVVWTTRPERAQTLCELPASEFLAHLQRQFGARLGAFTKVGARSLFPLVLKYATDVAQPGTILIGNAAQTLHPVAGQGFNLGLRDAWELAEEAMHWGREGIGSAAMLRAYRARRLLDRRGGMWFTHSLVRLFSNDVAPLKFARGAGLTLLGCIPPAKNFVVRRMTFGARG